MSEVTSEKYAVDELFEQEEKLVQVLRKKVRGLYLIYEEMYDCPEKHATAIFIQRLEEQLDEVEKWTS